MASTLSQKWLTIFCLKAHLKKYIYFLPCDFIITSPACGSNTYQIMYGETSNFAQHNGFIDHSSRCKLNVYVIVHTPKRSHAQQMDTFRKISKKLSKFSNIAAAILLFSH